MTVKFLSSLTQVFKQFFVSKTVVKSFTYFIPAPPGRKAGYREKEFDRVFFHFINQGHKILFCKTEAVSTPQSSGMWILLIVEGRQKIDDEIDFEKDNQNDL